MHRRWKTRPPEESEERAVAAADERNLNQAAVPELR